MDEFSPLLPVVGHESGGTGLGICPLDCSSRVEERMNSLLGSLHGGVLSSLADSAVAIALFATTKPDEKPLTIELNVNYLRPAQGDEVSAEARIVSRGRTIAVGDVDITDKAGRLVAKSRATYIIVT